MEFKVKVYCQSRKERVIREGVLFKVYVNNAPEKGKANKRVLELLAEHLRIRKSALFIAKGLYAREKVIGLK